MSRNIRAFPITSNLGVGAAGVVVAGLPLIRLHGWILEEGGTAAGIVQFKSHIVADGNQAPTPVLPSNADPNLFTRSIAVSTNDTPPWFTEGGLLLPGGLFVCLLTGTAAITGSIFYS